MARPEPFAFHAFSVNRATQEVGALRCSLETP
ncbi:hypothetical protein SAMN05421862_15214 [Pseudomonas extremaustralis]|jgi:hypothetical protein|uniref:Uncharacterized protein n=1 Tax=Pseudomonas extremaustralis TaxID=359110 RepID=A0ABY0MYW0_9PSED|nr:hypothetical protein SAMN05216591_0760 [Pseudomonas extremaustralis]SKB10612.1 hypothetical protein SAMN05421862_15214 [Pseudomonas extremaustralis]